MHSPANEKLISNTNKQRQRREVMGRSPKGALGAPFFILMLFYWAGRNRCDALCGAAKNGFGMGPIVGKVLADLIAKGRTDHDLSAFRADRFGWLGRVRRRFDG